MRDHVTALLLLLSGCPALAQQESQGPPPITIPNRAELVEHGLLEAGWSYELKARTMAEGLVAYRIKARGAQLEVSLERFQGPCRVLSAAPGHVYLLSVNHDLLPNATTELHQQLSGGEGYGREFFVRGWKVTARTWVRGEREGQWQSQIKRQFLLDGVRVGFKGEPVWVVARKTNAKGGGRLMLTRDRKSLVAPAALVDLRAYSEDVQKPVPHGHTILPKLDAKEADANGKARSEPCTPGLAGALD